MVPEFRRPTCTYVTVNCGALKRCYGRAHEVVLVRRAGRDRELVSVGKLMKEQKMDLLGNLTTTRLRVL
jgi:hypothetical protein